MPTSRLHSSIMQPLRYIQTPDGAAVFSNGMGHGLFARHYGLRPQHAGFVLFDADGQGHVETFGDSTTLRLQAQPVAWDTTHWHGVWTAQPHRLPTLVMTPHQEMAHQLQARMEKDLMHATSGAEWFFHLPSQVWQYGGLTAHGPWHPRWPLLFAELLYQVALRDSPVPLACRPCTMGE